MSTYVSISREEMDDVLKADKGWTVNGDVQAREVVYDFVIPSIGKTVRVYSSVTRDGGRSRGVGRDAIRICVPKLVKSVRVNRVPGWQQRLREAVINVIQIAVQRCNAKPAEQLTDAENFAGIAKLFSNATGKLKRPKLAFDLGKHRVRLNIAGDRSRYPGTIAVTNGEYGDDSVYFGRIMTDGEFRPGRDCNASVRKFLRDFADNPAKAAAEYGKMSGHCCFCSQKLTDSRSVDWGYGPVCAKNWGLPWGNMEEIANKMLSDAVGETDIDWRPTETIPEDFYAA